MQRLRHTATPVSRSTSLPSASARPAAVAALRFGDFALDPAQARLTRAGVVIELPPRPLALLCALVARAGQLMTKDQLLDLVWAGAPVGEAVLKSAVNVLRHALQDAASAPRYVQTVARLGYRFVAEVQAIHAAAAAPTMAAPTMAPSTAPPDGQPQVLEVPDVLDVLDGDLFGRADETRQLRTMLQAHRLVSLVGTGGVGKTRLAQAVIGAGTMASPDGAWWVRLDGVADASSLAPAVASALRLSAEAARDAGALVMACRTLALTVVLDNCEHLLACVAPLVRQWLDHAPGVRVLVTSQEPLHIAGEQVLRLGALPLPPPGAHGDGLRFGAVALFVQRVRSRQPDFVFNHDNAAAVCALCAALDALPLALELAAARVPLLGVEGVRMRLDDRLQLLTHGPRDLAARHRTLRGTLDWSYQLLSADEQAVLRRLSVFAGGFSVAAAQAVVCDEQLGPWAVLDALGALHDKSLLVAIDAPAADAPLAPVARRRGDPPATTARALWIRLRMLDSVRSFAAQALAEQNETARYADAHVHWMLAHLEQAQQDAHDTPTLHWTRRLLPEVDNLRAALRRATSAPELRPQAVALFAHSELFWYRAGLPNEALRWSEAVSAWVHPELPAALRAAYWQATAALCAVSKLGSPKLARLTIDQAIPLHRDLGDAFNEYYDLYLQAQLMLRTDSREDFSAMQQRMRALEAPDWGVIRRRYRRWLTCAELRAAQDFEGYRRFHIDEIALLRAAGDDCNRWYAEYGLALAEHDLGRPHQAIAVLQPTVDEIRRAGLLRAFPALPALLASMLLEQGSLPAGQAQVQEALALLRANNTLWWMATALPWAAHWAGRPEDAARVMGWADAWIARLGERAGPFFARMRAGCEERLLQALGQARYDTLHEAGSQLDEATALALLA